MPFRRRVLIAVPVVLTMIYLGYPYATLYQPGVAMRQADAATLQTPGGCRHFANHGGLAGGAGGIEGRSL